MERPHVQRCWVPTPPTPTILLSADQFLLESCTVSAADQMWRAGAGMEFATSRCRAAAAAQKSASRTPARTQSTYSVQHERMALCLCFSACLSAPLCVSLSLSNALTNWPEQIRAGRSAHAAGTFSQTDGSFLTVILHINDVPCCWNQSEARDYCRAHYYDLASIHNVQENDAVLLACMSAGASALVGDWVDQVRLTGTFSPATHFLLQI